MRILQIIQKPQLRGVEIFTSQLSNHLIDSGYEVKMVCLFEGNARLPFRGEIVNLKRPPSGRLVDLRGWLELARLIRNFAPDVVQANAGDTLKYAVLSRMLFPWKAKLIFRNASKSSDFIKSSGKLRFNRFLTRRIDYVISVSELCRLDFVNTFRFPEERSAAVPVGFETSFVGAAPEDVMAIGKRGPLFVNVGSLVPEKNHRGLLLIFQMIRKHIPAAQLVIVGGGKLMEELKNFAQSIGIDRDVHFLGYRNDVLNIVKASTAFVLPSLIEGLPGAIIEAQYCRVPVIAYNVGGISEAVIPACTGWLVEEGDQDAFVNAAVEVLHGGPTVESMVNRAHMNVFQHYENRKLSRRFAELYNTVLSV